MMRSRLTLKVKVQQGHRSKVIITVCEVNKHGIPAACNDHVDSQYDWHRLLCTNTFHVANLYLLLTAILGPLADLKKRLIKEV